MTGDRVDLDDTRLCPIADRCAVCGQPIPDGPGRVLDRGLVRTAESQLGVMCLTLCHSCVDAGRPVPGMSVMEVVDAVMAHCEHLGIDADEMAALMEGEV